jgi:hypothetical protein
MGDPLEAHEECLDADDVEVHAISGSSDRISLTQRMMRHVPKSGIPMTVEQIVYENMGHL